MITRWTLKDLLRARWRTLTSSLAVAAAFTLVLAFDAVWTGETDHAVAYIENSRADVWVMQKNVHNMHMASSLIRDTKRDRVAEVDGVAEVASILYLNTLVEARTNRWFSYVVGVERPGQLGGPWSITRGHEITGRDQAVIPETMAALADLRLHDRVTIAGRSFEVVGLSSGTFSIGNPVTFVHTLDVADILTLAGYDSYVLVRATPGVTPQTLVERIRAQVDDVSVLTTDEFVANDRVLIEQMGIELIAIMTFVGTALAVCLVAFVVYLHVSHKLRELAVLKAVGFRNTHIFASVTLQAGVITGLAFVMAAVATLTLSQLGPALLPQLSMRVTDASLAKVGVCGLVVATLATLASARRVATTDPMTVFQS